MPSLNLIPEEQTLMDVWTRYTMWVNLKGHVDQIEFGQADYFLTLFEIESH